MKAPERLDQKQEEKFDRYVELLSSVHERILESYCQHSSQIDLSPDYNAINAWPTITLAYSGIEQSMKLLLDIKGGPLPNELSRTHNISELFSVLPEKNQKCLQDSYSIYQSLHDYIPKITLDEFLDHIGDGYTSWRYFLTESEKKPPPQNSPGAMMEVWSALKDILLDRKLFHVKRRLSRDISDLITKDAWIKCIRENGEEEIQALEELINRSDDAINTYAEIFHHIDNKTLHVLNLSPRLQTVLCTAASLAEDMKTKNPDLNIFIERATVGQIQWNSCNNRFICPRLRKNNAV